MEAVDKTFEDNIGKALAPTGSTPKPTPPKKSPTVGKKPTAELKPAIKPAIDGLAAPAAVQTPQPGSPCQVKGCLGRYSILQTTKQKGVRLRALICRTCNHQPDEPHRSPL